MKKETTDDELEVGVHIAAEFVAAGDGRLAPARPCEKHAAYNSDYCPRCGTAAVIGGRS